MATARLWVTVEYFHPYLLDRNIDWDGALVKALPQIRSANSGSEFRAGISALLNELHDPETYILPDGQPNPSEKVADSRQLSLLRTATESAFVLTPDAAATKHALVDVAGMRALVRLSEAAVSLPTHAHAAPIAESSDSYPRTELRLLAGFKIWGAIRYFFAYKDLMDEDWDDVFVSYLPKLIAAHDAMDYNLTVAELLTHLTDSNTAAHSKTLDEYFGKDRVGLSIRMLDRYPIVTRVREGAAEKAVVHPGDVVKRIGDESITDRFRRFVQYVPASTPQRSGYDTIQRIANGASGTDVELAIENAKGEAHVVKLTRRQDASAWERDTEAVQVIKGNIGYLDLDRLTGEAAEAALSRLADTKAIIFDLRGSHAPAADVIAKHLTSQANVATALVTTPVAMTPDVPEEGIATQTTSTFLVRTLPFPAPPIYKGKTVALINEQTIGDAEYAGLLFEAANKTEFVGEPSAGACSTVAEIIIPGGITFTYSTKDIRHSNGGKLQRLGLQPNVLAPTTAKGLRAGKDETLDAAVSHLSQ